MKTFMQYIEESNPVLDKMSGYLNQLAANFQLIAHQTMDTIAPSIMKTGFGKSGLYGTSLLVNPQSIIQTASTMFSGDGVAQIHKGANSLVVLAFPKQIIQKYNLKDMRDIDDHLMELYSQGRIPIFGLPSKYIVGYFANRQFFANGQFNPDIKLLMI